MSMTGGKIKSLRSSGRRWGAPPSNDEFYRILDTGRIDAAHAWADVIQAREGKFFRETRLYRLRDGEWLRTPTSDPAWWGDEQTIATPLLSHHLRRR